MQLRIPDFGAASVLVAGDVMLDRYWHGETARISPEAPVAVVRVGQREERPGGAANVALNIGALGAAVSLVGLVGADADGRALEERLGKAGVRCYLNEIPEHPTICKLRVLSARQQLIRLDFEQPFPPAAAASLRERFEDALPNVAAVVLSDYAKGTLAAAPELIARARKAGKPVLVDPKGADFTRYRGATLLTPNRKEFEAVVGSCRDQDELAARAQALLPELDLEAMLVTRGEQGMTLVRRDAPALHLPAHAREVFDVTGAGDTVISVLAAALAAGAGLEAATALANVAAGLVVAKVGTASVSSAELRAAVDGRQHGAVLASGPLQALLAEARARGERIVFTNGCFDVLHAGHVAYLEQARELGDRLVVAVNDDGSVRRLKGAERPVNPLPQRMAVLAALSAVDWVVPFSEDTPAALIERLRPDVLVKGGDYRPEDVAGGDSVRARGGEVVILDYVDGLSTSAMIDRIRGR
jgi:D-beta-D-heptose 7-phosphate kinase/D-beta-D-heptose 1-phosphate adenosyltransferase